MEEPQLSAFWSRKRKKKAKSSRNGRSPDAVQQPIAADDNVGTFVLVRGGSDPVSTGVLLAGRERAADWVPVGVRECRTRCGVELDEAKSGE